MSAETYCMNRPTHLAGALCHNRIPVDEKLCADCKPQAQPDSCSAKFHKAGSAA